MITKVRNENEIFQDLEALCASPGYAHAIAFFCFRDNTIKHSGVVQSEDILQQFSKDSLVRTEISTLIGLLCKGEIDFTLPSPQTLQEYMDKTEELLQEMHNSIIPPLEKVFDPKMIGNTDFNPFKSGDVLREAIFYGGESAYHFQYRDLSSIKYQKDNDWLVENKGFSVEQAVEVMSAIQKKQNEILNQVVNDLPNKHPDEWSMLDACIPSELVGQVKVN